MRIKYNHQILKRCAVIVIFLLTLQFLVFNYQKSKPNEKISNFISNFKKVPAAFKISSKINENELKNGSSPDDRVCWEDLKFLEYEKRRRGPGEHGEFFNLTDPKEIEENQNWFAKEGFYVIVSDKISADRALPEQRPEKCFTKKYRRQLPKVSVIICFHNEILSVLKRCIHSVINRSPPQLLHEIVLVNDASTYENLGDELENYIKKDFFEGKIKFHKNSKREGLIRARMIGARLAEAEVIIFLDSHMEVTTTWLPPLLDPIVDDPTTATVPITKGMDAKTFMFDFVGPGTRGMFDWTFRYQWYAVRKNEHPELGENYDLPCMTGGAYAIRREHFFYLGGYDEGLQIWNGENYELSLKLWLCSGRLIAVPCSAVLHLSKHHAAHRTAGDGSDFIGRNLKRVAEVWLDDYKKYFYRTNQARYDAIDAGDLTKQFELKEKLKCKPFQYYLDNVAQEMLEKYPIEPRYVFGGSLRHDQTNLCLGLTAMQFESIPRLVACSDDPQKPNKGSSLMMTYSNAIRYDNYDSYCLDAHKPNFLGCHDGGGNQAWFYNPSTGHIRMSYVNRCLTGKGLNYEIFLSDCDDKAENQKWSWSLRNETAIEEWRKSGKQFIYKR